MVGVLVSGDVEKFFRIEANISPARGKLVRVKLEPKTRWMSYVTSSAIELALMTH